MTPRLTLLDRDGVINADSPSYIKHVDEWHPIPGSIEAIARLSRNGHRVHIVTNQSGLARGLFTAATLEKIHHRLLHLVTRAGGHLDGIFYCPHAPHDRCDCRKPRPGLLLAAAQASQSDLAAAAMIGDSFSDILAARTVGARPILVKTGNGFETLFHHPELIQEIAVFENLMQAAEHLLASE